MVSYIKIVVDLQHMTSTAQQFEQLKQQMRRQEAKKAETSKVRTINTIKWKNLMIHTLDKLKACPAYDQNLLDDLKIIIGKIPEEKFIEAIINIQPYKPQFTTSTYQRKPIHPKRAHHHPKKFETSPGKDSQEETTTSSSWLKNSYFEQKSSNKKLKQNYQLFSTFIQQEHLSKQLSSPGHPYSKIIDGAGFLLQSKYKIKIQQMNKEAAGSTMEAVCSSLEIDIKMLQMFFLKASSPFVQIFSHQAGNDKSKFQEDVHNFVINFLRNNDRFCTSLKKIIRFASKKSVQMSKFSLFCPDVADIDRFEISKELKIEGCYVYTANELIQFSQLLKGKQSLDKLAAIRQAFYKDINEYIQINGGKFAQVSGQSQLQIFKFVLTKLKIFSAQIFAQLKYLEVLFGEEEMGFHYDDASYIHSQLLIGFQAIRENL